MMTSSTSMAASTSGRAWSCCAEGLSPGGLAGEAFGRELVEIILPVGFPIAPELEQVVPAVDAGRVHVVEYQPDGIIADRMDFEDRDVPLAGDRLALVRRVALN